MNIQFLCPRWGAEQIGWRQFLTEVKQAGYGGIEWFPLGEARNDHLVLDLLEQLDLTFSIVMAVASPYRTFEHYILDLKKDLLDMANVGSEAKRPLFISAQTGREFFRSDQILQCLRVCSAIEKETGIPVLQETHRNKWSYGAHTVSPILQKVPDLKLTLDVSHWFCVSESYLEDQQDAINLAVTRAQHIHARVGHIEGAQVFDPALPEYAEALDAHLKIWDAWIAYQRSLGKDTVTITPEFGPQPYLTRAGRKIDLQKEQWRLNLWMKSLLEDRYTKRTS